MAQIATFHFVRLWQENDQPVPTIQQRVLAPSEGQAVVQVMKEHHLHFVARAWVSRRATDTPTTRLACVIVKGSKRSWKHEVEEYRLRPFLVATRKPEARARTTKKRGKAQ